MNAATQITSLSQMLPYDLSTKSNGDIEKALRQYQFLLKLSSAAIVALESGALSKFDALVGENACQIRAVIIIQSLPTLLPTLPDLHIQIKKAEHVVDTLPIAALQRAKSSVVGKEKKGKTLAEVFAENKDRGLDVKLRPDQLFFIQAYLLCITKVYLPSPNLSLLLKRDRNWAQLAPFGTGLTKNFAEQITARSRRDISRLSAAFVRDRAHGLNDRTLTKMTSHAFEVEYQSLVTCIPMFWTYKTLLRVAHQENIPLVFKGTFQVVEEGQYKPLWESWVYFMPVQGQRELHYERYPAIKIDVRRPLIAFEGVVCANTRAELPTPERWRDALTFFGPANVVLAAAADHRQYPDPKIELSMNECSSDPELLYFKREALERGLALSNPCTLFLQHVFATTIYDLSQAQKADYRVASKVMEAFIPIPQEGWHPVVVMYVVAYLKLSDFHV